MQMKHMIRTHLKHKRKENGKKVNKWRVMEQNKLKVRNR